VTAGPGELAALCLTGAHVTGALELDFADVGAPIELERCAFDGPVSLFGARLRRVSLAGRDDDARTVLLAGERRRRGGLSGLGRAWCWLQDLTVGYGYRSLRAAGWLLLLFAIGTGCSSCVRPGRWNRPRRRSSSRPSTPSI
jgi:hypothetical protein